MKRKPHSTSLVLLLVCIFTFWWGISVLAQHDTMAPASYTTSPLVVNEAYSNGTYTYSGVFMSPSVCDSFGSGIRFSPANGGHVSILLTTGPSSTACAQAAGANTGEPFSVSVKSKAANAPQFDGVILNGNTLPAQLVQAM